MKTRRVIIATGIYPPEIGGSATFAKTLVGGLQERGIDPSVVNFGELLALPRGVRHAVFLRRILARGKADVVLALDPVSSGLPAALAARLLSTPLVLRVGGDYAWEQAVQRSNATEDLDHFAPSAHGGAIASLWRAESWVAQHAARVIVPSKSMRSVAERWGVSPERIVMVHNAFDDSELCDLPGSREEARERLGMRGRRVLSVGRLLRLKGFEAVIVAVLLLAREFPDLRLSIIGSGPQLPGLTARVAQEHGEAIVDMLGPRPHADVLLHMKAADLVVLNSASEGMPHALMEAMALGTPVVASRVSGITELIDGVRNGLLVPRDDAAGIADALRSLMRDPGRAGSLAREARKTIGAYNRERMTREILAVLDSVG